MEFSTGCRDYAYGEDPYKYQDLTVECYNKYCEVYPDEAKRREDRNKGIDPELFREGGRKFLDMHIHGKGEPRVVSDMDEVRAEAIEKDAQRTIELRKKEFRKICEEQGLAKFFE